MTNTTFVDLHCHSTASDGTLSPTEVVDLAKRSNLSALALTDRSVSLDDLAADPPERLALVLGTEGDGLARRTVEAADVTVRIPMAGGVDSLNVAAAGAVAFWALRP